MRGLFVVFKKELRDLLGSRRFFILFLLVVFASLSSTYYAAQGIMEEVGRSPFAFLLLFTTSGRFLPSFLFFISFFGPLIGIIFGFDAINREHASGTISRVLSQPIYRDSFINGKFLAGITTLAILLLSMILLISGIGLRMLGVPPTRDEILRLVFFFVFTLFYFGFWLSLSILFSIIFRTTTTSALMSIGVWMFFVFFMFMIAGVIADTLVPVQSDSPIDVRLHHDRIERMIMLISPTTLYQEGVQAILIPLARGIGLMLLREPFYIPTPIPISESLKLVWPQITSLVALTLFCFACSYYIFMRQEIRS